MSDLKLSVYEHGCVVQLLKRRGKGKVMPVAEFAVKDKSKEQVSIGVAEVLKQYQAKLDAGGS